MPKNEDIDIPAELIQYMTLCLTLGCPVLVYYSEFENECPSCGMIGVPK